MSKKTIFNYEFETDGILPSYKLIIHFRGISNEYLKKIFIASLKKHSELKTSGLKYSSSLAEKFVDEKEYFIVPAKFHNSVRTAVRKLFFTARSSLEKKHDINFLTWDVEEVVYYKNAKDSNEWVLLIAYKGDYEDV